MRKNFDYWKIRKDNLSFQEAINLYRETTEKYGINFALYHSWDGKFDLHRGRLIGPHDTIIENQTFTLDEINATDWMLLEEDKEMNKKLYHVYNYVINFFSDEEYEKLQLRDRDINELFDILVKEKMTIDNKVNIIDFLISNSIIASTTAVDD